MYPHPDQEHPQGAHEDIQIPNPTVLFPDIRRYPAVEHEERLPKHSYGSRVRIYISRYEVPQR